MMRAPLLAGLLVAAVTPGSAAGAQQRQLITRAELEAGGWTRVSELVFAARGLARTSVDGITVVGSAGGSSPAAGTIGGPALTVLIDGGPMPVDLGDVPVLDLLPVSLAQVESVTVHRTPVVAAGRLAMHGLVHVHTRRPARAEASAAFYSGNEAGDPGPFSFTPRATPNVDNSGPFVTARLAHGGGGGDVDVSLRRWTDNLTDSRLMRRYEAQVGPGAAELWVRQLGASARGGVNAGRWRHDLHGGAATLRGTFFLPLAEEDQSLRTTFTYAGVAGSRRAGDAGSIALGYRAGVARLEAEPYGSPLPSTFAHAREDADASLSASWNRRGLRIESGIVATYRRAPLLSLRLPFDAASAESTAEPAAGAPMRHFDTTAAVGRARAGAFVTVGDTAIALRPVLHAELAHGPFGWGGGALLTLAQVRPTYDVTLTAAVQSQPRGNVSWTAIDPSRFVPDGVRQVSRSLDLEAARTVARARLALGAGLRRADGWLLAARTERDAAVPVVLHARSGHDALGTAELRASADLPLGPRLTGGAAYRFITRTSGGEPSRIVAATIPRHLLDASVVVTPASDIRLRVALNLASRTAWLRPDGSDELVPAVTRLDLAVEKWLLRGRLRGQLVGRNLLNDAERYHPLGADFRLRIFAGATLLLQ